MVDHQGEILLKSFIYVNPKNVLDYITASQCKVSPSKPMLTLTQSME